MISIIYFLCQLIKSDSVARFELRWDIFGLNFLYSFSQFYGVVLYDFTFPQFSGVVYVCTLLHFGYDI